MNGPLLLFEIGSAQQEPRPVDAARPLVFAMEVKHVRQVMEAGVITGVPLAPDIIEGVLNHHGRIVTIVDPAPLLQQPAQPQAVNQVVILRRPAGIGGQIGIKIARTREIVAADQLVEADVPAPPGIAKVLLHKPHLVHVISYAALLSGLSACFEVPARGTPSRDVQGVRP